MYFFQNFQRQFLDGLHNPLIRPAISWEGWHWGGVGPLRFPWFNEDIPIYYKSLTWMFRPFWEGIPLLFKHQMWGGVIWTTKKNMPSEHLLRRYTLEEFQGWFILQVATLQLRTYHLGLPLLQWFCPHTLGRYPKLPQNPHKGRNSFINCWWNVRGIFHGALWVRS